MSSDWRPIAPTSRMAIAQVHLDGIGSALLDNPMLVTPAERWRARTLRGNDAARRYLRGRAALRVLLARECGTQPALVAVAGSHGVLPAAGSTFSYSMGSAGGLAVFALGLNQPLAIAVEEMRGQSCGFRAAQRALTRALGPAAPGRASLRGLREGARALVVSGWTVQLVPTMPGYFVAVAGKGEGWGYQLVSPFFPV